MTERSIHARTAGVLFALFAGLALAISPESFWIDEANAALKAVQPDIQSWWDTLVLERGSDMQMPLYMFYIWVFGKLFGTTEYALRMANLPWLVLGFGAWFTAFSEKKRLRAGVAVVLAISPFVWFYMNEARPYAMQIGGSFLVLAAFHRLSLDVPLEPSTKRFWSIGLVVGMFVVSASSMLGVIWVVAGLLAAVCVNGWKHSWNLVKSFPFIWIFTLVSFLILGIYYVWTLQLGARASGAAATDLKNLAFVGYEFFGFSGLGPGRLELRTEGINSLIPFALFLTIHGIAVVTVLSIAWNERAELGKELFWPILIALGTVVIFLFLGYVAHFRLLGRHFTPLAAVIISVLGLGVSRAFVRQNVFLKGCASLFIASSIISCLLLRFSSRHAKDDYRAAAAWAKDGLSAGKTVLWNADRAGALYYGVPIANQVSNGKAWLINNPEAALLEAAFPDIVIASKPDLYDQQNILGKFLDERSYKRAAGFPAFSIWEKPSD